MLNPKQLRFCEEYLTDLNATAAAIRAGYSKKTSYSIGSENLRKPEIRQFINNKLAEYSLTAEETTKLLTDIARGNLGDYFITRQVVFTPKMEKSLKTIIRELKNKIEFEEEYLTVAKLSSKEKSLQRTFIKGLQRDLIRTELELKRNSKATRIVDGESKLVETVELDIKKLVEDKEKGRIKSIVPNEFGLKIEMHDAHQALTNLAKMHGLFEKDNKQKATPSQLSDDQFQQLLNSAYETKAHTSK